MSTEKSCKTNLQTMWKASINTIDSTKFTTWFTYIVHVSDETRDQAPWILLARDFMWNLRQLATKT